MTRRFGFLRWGALLALALLLAACTTKNPPPPQTATKGPAVQPPAAFGPNVLGAANAPVTIVEFSDYG